MSKIAVEHSRLKRQHNFIMLCALLSKIPDKDWKWLEDIGNWLDRRDVNSFKRQLVKRKMELNGIMATVQSHLPPKRPWEEIESDMEMLTDLVNKGVPFGWIDLRFDHSKLALDPYMPYHAWVGFGHGRGFIYAEEDAFMRDAAFMLLKAKRNHDRFEIRGSTGDEQTLKLNLGRDWLLSASIGSFSRASILASYGFVEALVNSIAHDYAERHPNSVEAMETIYLGRMKDGTRRPLRLEDKVMTLQMAIRPDGRAPFVTTDEVQMTSEASYFFGEMKSLRDYLSHHSKAKVAVWNKPQQWMDYADKAFITSLDVAKAIYRGCYPDRPDPKYLYGLDATTVLSKIGEQTEVEENAVREL